MTIDHYILRLIEASGGYGSNVYSVIEAKINSLWIEDNPREKDTQGIIKRCSGET